MKKRAATVALLALALFGTLGTAAQAAGPKTTTLAPCWYNWLATCAYVEQDGRIVEIYQIGFKSPLPGLGW